ncbi:THUMP domain-containing protein 1 isoform X2 [Festucalex cinctus]
MGDPTKLEEDAGGYGEDDVEDALRREVAQMRAYDGTQERRFQALESGANNIIFIRTLNLEPDRLVHHILSDLHATKKKKTRVVLRMLPVMGTCRAFPEDMMGYLSNFLQPWFKRPNRAIYQIAFKARNNNHLKRDDVLKAIANLVSKLNPKNKVNLTEPDLTIILEVIKTVCCVSVVREYKRYKKYNLQEVLKEDEPKKEDGGTGAEKVAEPPAGEEEAAKEVEDGSGTEKIAEPPAGEEEAAKNEEDGTGTEKVSEAPVGEEEAAEVEKCDDTVAETAAEAVKKEEAEAAAAGGSEDEKQQPGEEEDMPEESAMEDDDVKGGADGE